jgi:hypothetical protein
VSEGARDEREEREKRALRALLRRTGFRRDRFGEGPESVEIQALEKRRRSVSRPWLASEELSNTLLKSLQQRQAQATSFNNNNIRAEEIPHFGSFNQNPVAGVGG